MSRWSEAVYRSAARKLLDSACVAVAETDPGLLWTDHPGHLEAERIYDATVACIPEWQEPIARAHLIADAMVEIEFAAEYRAWEDAL